jgi:hypothetical protein
VFSQLVSPSNLVTVGLAHQYGLPAQKGKVQMQVKLCPKNERDEQGDGERKE